MKLPLFVLFVAVWLGSTQIALGNNPPNNGQNHPQSGNKPPNNGNNPPNNVSTLYYQPNPCHRISVFILTRKVMPATPIPTHLRATNLPMVHPFKIICYADNSVSIQNNGSYNLDLFVAGNVPSCYYHTHHFTIDNNKDIKLNSSCKDKKEGAFLIEVQNRPASTVTPTPPFVVGGNTSIVYRVTCIPDTDGDPVSVSMAPPVSVKATASELVLPALQIGVFGGSSSPDMKQQTQSLTLGSKVNLVIYNDHRSKRMSYMLIPSKCTAYPDGNKKKASLPLLDDDGISKCTREDTLLSKFNVTNTSDYDLAYATLYPFKFEGYPDIPVVLECTVYICPKDDVVDGIRSGFCAKQSLKSGNRCSQVSPTTGYAMNRRRRDVGVGESGVGRATLRATFSVQEPLVAGASRCSAGMWVLVALLYIFK